MKGIGKTSIKILFLMVGFLSSFSLYARSGGESNAQLKREMAALNRKVDRLNRKVQSRRMVTKNGKLLASPEAQPLILSQRFPKFHDIVTMNAPKSYANHNLCLKGMLCISGDANFDLKFFNRPGNAAGFGSFSGVGVRPLFGTLSGPLAFAGIPVATYRDNVLGSINNADLFVDVAVNDWLYAHMDLAYLNASTNVRTYSHNNPDWANAYRPAAALKVNEAYILFADPDVMPIYVKMGRMYLDFGNYDPYPMVKTLPQLLSEIRTGAIEIGVVFDNGIYASVNYSMAQASIENVNFISATAVSSNRDRNFGGMVGFKGKLFDEALHVNANASYIDDIRDSDYLNASLDVLNTQIPATPFAGFYAGQSWYMRRTPGLALHTDLQYGRFGVSGDYVMALGYLTPFVANNPGAAFPFNFSYSKIKAWAATASVDFDLFHRPSTFTFSYQGAADAAVVTATFPFGGAQAGPGAIFPVPFNPGNVLPKARWQWTYTYYVLPYLNVGALFLFDHDFSPAFGGTSRNSTITMIRVGTSF